MNSDRLFDKQLFDPIRQKKVAFLPEEVVRQNLLNLMVDQLQFPKGLISVEKELSTLPHLKNNLKGETEGLRGQKANLKKVQNQNSSFFQDQKLPLRRVDILVFGKNIHPLYPLYPLLMIECKKDKLTEAALQQVIGYNYHVQAYFVAVAGRDEIRVVFQDKKSQKIKTLDFLPSYLDLIRSIRGS